MTDYRAMARAAARRHGVDPGVFARQIGQESGFRPGARSPAGALGIAQIMPETAAGWHVDPMNPAQALDAAAKNMARYVHQYGSYENALRAYNAGPGAIQASKGYAETNNYVRTILGGHTPSAGPARSSSPRSAGQPPSTATTITTTPGVDNRQERVRALQSFLADRTRGERPSMTDLALQIRGLRDVPATTSTSTVEDDSAPGHGGTGATGVQAGSPRQHGTANFEGHTVAAWIKPALQYARRQGWRGQVTSGYRSVGEQAQLYKEFQAGTRAGPVAKPGTSHHGMADYPGGAVDVTDAQTLSRIISQSRFRRLKWAGAKDPPHFSHPSGPNGQGY